MTALKDRAYWLDKARQLRIEGRAFIEGAYVDARSAETFSSYSPVDGALLAPVALCAGSDVDLAVGAARRSFEAGVWSGLAARERKAVLLKWAALLEAHTEELALLESLDSGKPIADTLGGDLPGTIYCLRWFAELIDKVHGEVPATDPHFFGTVTQQPLGVVAAVVPWNYPLLMAAWKFAPALAAGNSVVLKPSEKTPLSALRIAALAMEAGLPAGVFNVVTGDGAVGRFLSLHVDVDCIAFTGSGRVGREIAQNAAATNLKRVWLELGGKSANIVMADCPDIAQAARSAAAAIFANMGQVCSAGSRLLVQRAIVEPLLRELLPAADDYLPGHPLDPGSVTGAIIDAVQFERVCHYIDIGKQEARLLKGGQPLSQIDAGAYLEPTIFLAEDASARIANEEIFGPVLVVIPFDTLEEAIAIANQTEFGLAAAVWSSDLATIHTATRQLKAGTVWVNCYDELVDMNFPFGGFKESGNGRDNSAHALSKYTELKSTIMRCS
ncbi:aldehyde dehydrogenase family protein [Pseudomonas sp. BJa5]|uniref:aldehyde dehydrogenase family protein n=1 Tax=Pseudomonas sp. BJa5 TaxID=2936270 RepID=UPI002559D69E|nr:aldehyde dehydrogenase family protein [Pseudomonas sp. BGr12]MDL2420979.1 aldehyde dehydrogenase family protein [Pseudomonas sp. BGr12]